LRSANALAAGGDEHQRSIGHRKAPLAEPQAVIWMD
jgi:hypothetical protein